MLAICNSVFTDLSVSINSVKSKCMCIGPTYDRSLANIDIGLVPLQWADSLTYLGVKICSGKTFKVDFSETRRKFFMSVNVILSKCKFTSDMVKLHLLESHCLPILTYATESLNLPVSQLKEINSWWNSAYRKIFGYQKWESVKLLICMLGRLDIHHLVNLRSIQFINNMSKGMSNNTVLKSVINVYSVCGEYRSLYDCYGCEDWWSPGKIKACIYSSFRNLASI